MPREIILGSKWKPEGTGTKRRTVEKKDCMYYIPIIETLQTLLDNEDILAEVRYNFL